MSEIIRIPTPGDLIGGQFELVRELGRGGYGVVFEAIQHGIDRKVAVKMLLPRALESQAKIVERFKREAKMASTLTHPSAVVIYAFGVHKGQQDEVELPYLAMEYLDGENVQEYMLRTGPLPPEQTQYILEQALGSLHEAHRKGIVHRDMKPDNLFLHQPVGEEMVVKVLDYGIAVACTPEWSQQERERLTKTGMVTGTAEYIAPEMVSGQGPVSPSVDVYSVGCVAYHMLTGTFPYQGNNPVEIAIKHLYEPTAELPAPFAASFLGQVVHRAMSKQPAQRYRDAGHMLKALRTGELWPEPDDPSSRLSSERQIVVPSAVRPSAAQAVVPSEPHSAGVTGVQAAPSAQAALGTQATLLPPPAPPKGKGPWLAGAALALVVALGALGWAWSQRDQPSEPAPAASAAPRVPQETPPAAQEAQVDLTSTPSAEVYAGERRLGQTPLTLRASELREAERGGALELRAAGHQPQTLSIDWANPKPSYAAHLVPSEPAPSEPAPSEPTPAPAELPNDAQAAGKPAPKPPTPKDAAPAGGEPPQGSALGAALEPQPTPDPQGEPPKEAPATAEPAKVEPPKVEPPKVEPPKVEPPKVEPPKVEPPKPAEKPKEEPAVPHSF